MKTHALIIITAVLLLIVFLLNTKVRIYVNYKEDLYSYARVFWFFKVAIYPEPEPAKSLSKKKLRKMKRRLYRMRKKGEGPKKERKSEITQAVGNVTDMVKELLELILILLKSFIGKVKINVKNLNIIVATNDAATTAMSYALVCDTLNVLMDMLMDNEKVNCRFERVDCSCDYLKTVFEAYVDIRITIRIWQVIQVLFNSMLEELKNNINTEDL